jgi:hypothetical protein
MLILLIEGNKVQFWSNLLSKFYQNSSSSSRVDTCGQTASPVSVRFVRIVQRTFFMKQSGLSCVLYCVKYHTHLACCLPVTVWGPDWEAPAGHNIIVYPDELVKSRYAVYRL